MTSYDRRKLHTAKLNWRKEMRTFFGDAWTKRNASNKKKDGTRMMNVSVAE